MEVNPAKDYNYDSEKNLLIKKRLCSFEVVGDATEMAEYMLADLDGSSPLKWNFELEHGLMCKCPYCGEDLDLEIMTTPHDHSVVIKIDENAPIDEAYLCPICGAGYASEEEARECCGSREIYQCPHCQNVVEEDEIYDNNCENVPIQWTIVSNWLGEALNNVDETVLCSSEGIYFWGRMTNGPYERDPAISKICYKLQILEGQKNFQDVNIND